MTTASLQSGSALVGRFQALPRSLRWLVAAAAGFAAYFLVVEPAVDYVTRTNIESDSMALRLQRLDAEREARAGAEQTIATGIARFGNVEFPGDPEVRSVEFNRQISEIIAKHNLKEDATTRTATLGAGPLAGVIGSDKRIERIVKELQITATPEQVIQLLADLERLPIVTTVSKVQIRKPTENERQGRKVKADISVETWVVARKGKVR
ncbi:MAG: hypothetical protein GIKADHBN_01901 [Phycisphaerales bacterium]|nr:hypothetical protein [Phycisphaerales bacterium]